MFHGNKTFPFTDNRRDKEYWFSLYLREYIELAVSSNFPGYDFGLLQIL